MSVTVAMVEAETIARIGPYMAAAGMDVTTVDGTNASLDGPIEWAAWRMNLNPADPFAIVDADLAGLDMAGYQQFLSLTEYRTLDTVWGNWAMYDQQLGSESQSLSQLREALEKRLAKLEAELGPLIGPTFVPGPPSHGVITAGLCYTGRGVFDRSSHWGPYP
jgi:hypothetical protein